MAESTQKDPLGNGVPPNPTDELLAMVTPQATASQFGTPPAVTPAPAPQEEPASRGGISPSISDQLRKIANGANALAASNPAAASQPMGWARTLLGGFMGSLAGGGINLGSPQPGPLQSTGIGGVQSALNARRQETQQNQDRAAKAKQQAFENNLATKKDEREQEQHDILIKAYQLNSQRTKNAMSKEEQDQFDKDVVAPWRSAEKEKGLEDTDIQQEVVGGGGLQELAKNHASTDDPQGLKWLHGHDVQDNGYVDDRDAQGNLTGTRSQKFLVGTYPTAPEHLSQAQVDDINKYAGLKLSVDDPQIQDPRVYAQLKHQVIAAKANEVMADKLALDMGNTKQQLEDMHNKADYPQVAAAFAPWVVAENGNQKQALIDLATHAAEAKPGPDGKVPPEAQKAQEMYNQVLKFFGPEMIKDTIAQYDKEQLEDIKSNAAAAKNKPLDVEGNATLSGPAYIASLPPQKQPLMKAFVNGQMGFPQIQRMMSGKDGQQFLAEVALADPGINGDLLTNVPQLFKNFTTGTESRAVNAGATALDSLKRLNDLSTPSALIPGTDANKRLEDQLVTTATEVQKFLIGGNAAPTAGEIEEMKEKLQSKTPWNRTSGILQQALTIQDKYNQYQNTWANGLPNDTWRKNYPMPGFSKEAIANGNYLNNVGNGMSYKDAEARRQQDMNGTTPAPVVPTGPDGSGKSTVTVGGKPMDVIHNTDGTVTIAGQIYSVGADRKTLTPVTSGAK